MSMTIKYDGTTFGPIHLPYWARPSRKDDFINYVVGYYLNQHDTREINWAADIKVDVITKTSKKRIRFDVADFIRIQDGKPRMIKTTPNF